MIPILEMPGSDALRVELSAFTGPLDLLLHLIKEQEMDIYDIRLEKLTEQYLARLDKMRDENLAVAGEFLVMAATLLYLKSRSLLPVQDRPPEDMEDEDPKWELIRQLIEYRKFKEAAGQLGDREALHSRIFGRTPERISAPTALQGPGQVSMFDLVWAFQKILRNVEDRARAGKYTDEEFTVSQQIEFLLDQLPPNAEVFFEDLFRTMSSRGEVVVTFLALLELIRLQQLTAHQDGPLQPICIRRVAEGTPEIPTSAEGEGAGQP
ncbi:MAG: segregation/condensation protein A, partial [Verrucomicrobia bacterium]|nr:segregation/condensation protein A [Verrucomicrobiota bacterium]